MRRNWGHLLFALQHSLCQLLEPFPNRVSLRGATVFLHKNMKLAPGDNDCSAKQVVHEIEGDFPAKEQDTETLPRQAEHEDIIRAFRTKDLANLAQVASVGK